LVVGTTINKTEILLGYSTQFGDAACAINPLGDLYKTQLRQLSVALGISKRNYSKPTSADLGVGQNDEAQLGFTYEMWINCSILLVDQRFSPQDCVEAGFSESFVERVVKASSAAISCA
jgi:NAD+ synthase